MFSLQPGQGLGFGASKELGLGLGTPFALRPLPEYVDQNVYGGGGKEYVSRFEWDDIIGEIERRDRIAQEDELILEVIMTAMTQES